MELSFAGARSRFILSMMSANSILQILQLILYSEFAAKLQCFQNTDKATLKAWREPDVLPLLPGTYPNATSKRLISSPM